VTKGPRSSRVLPHAPTQTRKPRTVLRRVPPRRPLLCTNGGGPVLPRAGARRRRPPPCHPGGHGGSSPHHGGRLYLRRPSRGLTAAAHLLCLARRDRDHCNPAARHPQRSRHDQRPHVRTDGWALPDQHHCLQGQDGGASADARHRNGARVQSDAPDGRRAHAVRAQRRRPDFQRVLLLPSRRGVDGRRSGLPPPTARGWPLRGAQRGAVRHPAVCGRAAAVRRRRGGGVRQQLLWGVHRRVAPHVGRPAVVWAVAQRVGGVVPDAHPDAPPSVWGVGGAAAAAGRGGVRSAAARGEACGRDPFSPPAAGAQREQQLWALIKARARVRAHGRRHRLRRRREPDRCHHPHRTPGGSTRPHVLRCGHGTATAILVLVASFLSQIYARLLGACTLTLPARLRVACVAVPFLRGRVGCGCPTCVRCGCTT